MQQQLTADLYYDLLDKYVQLQADYNRAVKTNNKLKTVLKSFEIYSEEDIKVIVSKHNKIISACIGQVWHNRENYLGTVQAIEQFKLTTDIFNQ